VAALTKSVLVLAFRRQERIQQVLTVVGISIEQLATTVIADTGEIYRTLGLINNNGLFSA